MKYWRLKNEVMEYWSNGGGLVVALQYSNTPILQDQSMETSSI